MKIEPEVEDPLRHAFAAALDNNSDGVKTPLEPLGEVQQRHAIAYAVLVVGYVMNDVHPEPDAEAAAVMAERLMPRLAEWVQLGEERQIAAFLLACATGDGEFTGVEPDDIPDYALVLGGELLGWYTPKELSVWDYLDRIWDYAESLPDPAT